MRTEFPPHSSLVYADRDPARHAPSNSTREFLIVAIMILFTSVTFFLIQYDRMRSSGPALEGWIQTMRAGVTPAPIQYRVALPCLVHFLEVHGHFKPNHSLPLLEFVAYVLALVLLYLIFRSSRRVIDAPPTVRLVLLGFFLTATQFPILWIFPWDRPETLPTFLFLTAIVLLIVGRGRMPFAVACLLTVLLSFGQALMRADVPIVTGIAILLAVAISVPFVRSGPRIAILGALCAGVGGAVQIYMQHIAYPHTTYPADTARFQLLANLTNRGAPFHMPIFLTSLLPFAFTLFLIRRNRLPLESSDKLVLLMCLAYLPAWVITGMIVEVRIFVPFLFLASPTIAKLWTAYLFGPGNETPPLLAA